MNQNYNPIAYQVIIYRDGDIKMQWQVYITDEQGRSLQEQIREEVESIRKQQPHGNE